MACVSSTSLAVLVNGCPTQFFKPSRGIRQGDPLSPYLFIICMDYLSVLITEAVKSKLWLPISISKHGPGFSHLLFADDIILFSQVDKKSIQSIHNILTLFSNLSGQKISLAKSRIYCSKNTTTSQKRLLSASFNFPITENLGKYLGFPLVSSTLKKQDFNFLIDNIQAKLSSWENRFLSPSGRTTLIKSTLTSIPIHIMQIFRLPAYTTNLIDKLCRNFLWGSTPAKQKLHPIKWATVCLPTQHGGLNIPLAKQRNQALLMSLSWRYHITTPNSLWACMLHSKYGSQTPLPPQFNQPTQFKSASPIWKSLIHGWNLCSQGLQHLLGNGSTTLFWHDCWCTSSPLSTLLFGPFPENETNRMVSSVISSNSWHLEHLPFVLPDHILIRIQSTFLPSHSKPDRLTWKFTPNGKFSTSSAFKALQQVELPISAILLPTSFSFLWKSLPTLPKIKHFLWLALHERLPTRLHLFHKQIIPSPLCENCNMDESILHLFRDCSFVKPF